MRGVDKEAEMVDGCTQKQRDTVGTQKPRIAAGRLGVRGYRDTVFQTGYRAILNDLPLITTTNTPDLGRLTSSLVDVVVADFKVMNNFFYYTIRKDKECFLNHLIPPIVFFIIFAQK